MEQEKNRNGIVVLLVILLIFVLSLGGYIAYDKVLGSKSDEYTPTKNNKNQVYSYNLAKRSTVQAVRQNDIEVLVDTDGNAYLYIINNLDNEDNSQIKTNLKNLETKFETYFPKGYTYIDGSTELKAYKLNVTNVLTSYYVHMGNGGFSYFIFVKENGKLSYLSYDKLIYDGKIELKDIDEIDNVVSVVENTYSMKPYVITSNGNELSLYDYIK